MEQAPETGVFGHPRIAFLMEIRVSYRRSWLGLAALVASLLVACGGGSSSSTVPAAPGSAPTTVPTTFPTTDPSGRPTTAPTTVPTTIPTNTPNSTLKVTPASLTLTSIGAQGTLTATQITPTALTTSGCTGVALANVGVVGPSTVITVTAAASGTCSLTIADANKQLVTVPITVSAAPAASPTPIDANHVAFVVQIAPGALTAPPIVTPSAVNIYITGQQTTTGANATCSSSSFLQVTDAQGDTAPLGTVPAIPFYGGATTSGLTSQVIQLPALCSGRIYISVNGPLTINSSSGPAPWASLTGFPTQFDVVEYTMPANALAAPSMDIDTTQENMIGLDLTMNMTGTQKVSQTTGLKAGFMTQVSTAAAALGSPWSKMINAQWPTRLLSPLSVQYVIGSAGNPSLPGFNPGNFLDTAIQTAWNKYASPACMNVTVSTATGEALAGKTLVGQVDGSGNFNFYDTTVACAANLSTAQAGHIVAVIQSPFDQNFWISNAAGTTTTSGGWSSATGSELMENGPYLLPASAPHAIAPNPMPFAVNATSPKSAADIGNTVATALNRGVFDPTVNAAFANQPFCPTVAQLYAAASPTLNMWSSVVWATAKNPTYGFGQAYSIPFDDKCGFSTDIQDSHANVVTITVNPN